VREGAGRLWEAACLRHPPGREAGCAVLDTGGTDPGGESPTQVEGWPVGRSAGWEDRYPG